MVLKALGGEGRVQFGLFYGVTYVTKVPTYGGWEFLVGIAGGGVVALLAMILDYVIQESDPSFALKSVAGFQIPYAICEGMGILDFNVIILCEIIGISLAIILGRNDLRKMLYEQTG
jgi:hypothetical protein